MEKGPISVLNFKLRVVKHCPYRTNINALLAWRVVELPVVQDKALARREDFQELAVHMPVEMYPAQVTTLV